MGHVEALVVIVLVKGKTEFSQGQCFMSSTE